jgi:hypothetical protein
MAEEARLFVHSADSMIRREFRYDYRVMDYAYTPIHRRRDRCTNCLGLYGIDPSNESQPYWESIQSMLRPK